MIKEPCEKLYKAMLKAYEDFANAPRGGLGITNQSVENIKPRVLPPEETRIMINAKINWENLRDDYLKKLNAYYECMKHLAYDRDK